MHAHSRRQAAGTLSKTGAKLGPLQEARGCRAQQRMLPVQAAGRRRLRSQSRAPRTRRRATAGYTPLVTWQPCSSMTL